MTLLIMLMSRERVRYAYLYTNEISINKKYDSVRILITKYHPVTYLTFIIHQCYIYAINLHILCRCRQQFFAYLFSHINYLLFMFFLTIRFVCYGITLFLVIILNLVLICEIFCLYAGKMLINLFKFFTYIIKYNILSVSENM